MENNFLKVKNYLIELDYTIVSEHEAEGVIVINNEVSGISNLVLGIADPLLIMEQFLFELSSVNCDVMQSLLMKNRDIIHGAFVLDATGKKVIFRDTLQLENLDLNEVEATLNSLSLLLSEYSEELINYAKI